MKEAKKRNPKIKLYGLAWTFPYHVEMFGASMVDYLVHKHGARVESSSAASGAIKPSRNHSMVAAPTMAQYPMAHPCSPTARSFSAICPN